MESSCVVELNDVSIFQSLSPFVESSPAKLVRDGVLVLSHIDLRINQGEIVYLVGRVGSGKSTLLKLLYAEIPLVSGRGRCVGFQLDELKRSKIPYLRRNMGIVFQDCQLLTDRNVFMNLHYVLRATGWNDETLIRERIDEVLTLVDLTTKCHKMPFELSGGEQQRLSIARAMLNRPNLILADEPTGNLDPVTSDVIMRLFQKIAANGCAVVMSTHNTSLIEEFPARTLLFGGGVVKEIDLKKAMQE